MGSGPAFSRDVALAVASRLDAVVPPHLMVRADGADVVLYSRSTPSTPLGSAESAAIAEDADGRTPGERIEVAVWSIINSIQDRVSEALREPWPRMQTGEMALPDTRLDGDRLLLWFGDERSPTVALLPISVAEVQQAT
jgi:hypothetical protein